MSMDVIRPRFVLAGACWGGLLAGCSFFAAGAGHGVYFPAALVSAPFGALGVVAALTGSIFLWPALAAASDRRICAALLLFHYAGIAVVYSAEPEYRDFGRFAHLTTDVRAVACTAVGLYAVGQIWIVLTTIRAFVTGAYTTR